MTSGESEQPEQRLVSVVDDDPSFLRSLGRLLRVQGYSVELFNSPKEFLGSVDEHLPACLMLDVQMPGMTGPQLADTLISQGISLPTIFFTAQDTPQVRELALRPGTIALLIKPFESGLLFDALEKACATARH